MRGACRGVMDSMKTRVLFLLFLFSGCAEKKVVVGDSSESQARLVEKESAISVGDLRLEIRFLAFGGEEEQVATLTVESGELSFETLSKVQIRLPVSEAQELELKKVIASAEETEWSGYYFHPHVLDGGGIECSIKLGDREFSFMGVNACPPCFCRLLEALDSIKGGESFSRGWWSNATRGIRVESFDALRKMEKAELEALIEGFEE